MHLSVFNRTLAIWRQTWFNRININPLASHPVLKVCFWRQTCVITSFTLGGLLPRRWLLHWKMKLVCVPETDSPPVCRTWVVEPCSVAFSSDGDRGARLFFFFCVCPLAWLLCSSLVLGSSEWLLWLPCCLFRGSSGWYRMILPGGSASVSESNGFTVSATTSTYLLCYKFIYCKCAYFA